MNYNDSLPTVPTTITGLTKARDTLSPYLLDVANAVSTGEAPPGQLDDQLTAITKAMEHIQASIKLLTSLHPAVRARTSTPYYYMRQDGSERIVLAGFAPPMSLYAPKHSSWPTALNTAYAVLQHQQGDDYAMLWAPKFHDQVTSKLTQPGWILSHQEVNDWINDHNWLSPSPPEDN